MMNVNRRTNMAINKTTRHSHQLSRRDFIVAAGASVLTAAQAQSSEGSKSKNSIVVRVDAGPVNRLNELVSFPVDPKARFSNWTAGTSRLALSRLNERGEVVSDVPCQFEPETRQLSWLTGHLQKGESAQYGICCSSKAPAQSKRYRIGQKPAHLMINVDDA
ncbi:MAG: hypothetical protein WC740_14400, partial [Verrucomicrobiia bacterium]